MASSSDRTSKVLFDEIDKLAYFGSIIGTIILAVLYIVLWQIANTQNALINFALTLIPDFISVLVLFTISYTFFRRIQKIKEKQEAEELTESIAKQTHLLISEQIKGIEDQLGLTARFVTDLPKLESVGNLYREVTNLVEQADKEILILWHHNNFAAETLDLQGRNKDYMRERSNFYETLLHKCEQHCRDAFFYRRIFQIETKTDQAEVILPSNIFTPSMSKHCKDIIEFRKQYPKAALIKVAHEYLENTLMIIDKRYVVWEIDAIDPESKYEFFDGAIIFEDRNGSLVKYLHELFMSIDANSSVLKDLVEV